MGKYDKCIKQWDEIFSKASLKFPTKKESGNKIFDKGLEWLTKDSDTVLDFGCGNGTVLFWCSLYGTKKHIGIDLSKQAIENAKVRSEKSLKGEFNFKCGGVESLKDIKTESVDAAVLSNIIDNVYPEDATVILTEIKRILKKNGKVLVKLNPYITDEEIKEQNIKIVDKNVLDDGMILWNNTTEEWNDFLESKFYIEHYEDIYYEEYEQYNRMYLLSNR